MDDHFNLLIWIMGIDIVIAAMLLGAILQMRWQTAGDMVQWKKAREAHKPNLETQKDELNFLKGLIEKLLPPKGVL